jgi:hypothetical protein
MRKRQSPKRMRLKILLSPKRTQQLKRRRLPSNWRSMRMTLLLPRRLKRLTPSPLKKQRQRLTLTPLR